VSDDASRARRTVDRLIADRLAVRGQVDEARILFHRSLAVAEELDETWVSVLLQFQLCELELRAGGWDAAEELLNDIVRSPSRSQMGDPELDRCAALLAAGRGRVAEAERRAAHTLEVCERRGLQWNRLEVLRARGAAALLAHEPERAAESLAAVWEHTEREGIEEPGEFPVAADLVEALVEAGRPDEAEAVSARLRALAEAQTHPWGLASAARCEALVALATDRDRQALERLVAAAADYVGLGLHFDHARTLLAAGRAARRLRMWGVARDLLAQAASAFERMGSDGWHAEVRSEMARIGGRSAKAPEELSPAEERVAALAAEGLANKEIAERLTVSVYTVERHLTHVYEKLGVRSRVELARHLAESA
jgi:DNA-binding NarL/FixJ family response regulator